MSESVTSPSCRDETRGPVGILVVNLGTPDEPTPGAIRKYLRQFLSDPRVVELPAWLWLPILNGPVLLRRPSALAPRYKSIWLENGSPLLVYSEAQAQGMARKLKDEGYDVAVEVGMRYGNPSLESAWKKLVDQGCERILILPLYPQYAASTTATAVDAITRIASRTRNQPEMRFIKNYPTFEPYVDALAGTVRALWDREGQPQRLVMSFHGLPRRSVDLGDPYLDDCYATAHALGARLGQTEGQYVVTFQSRIVPSEWLQPYTEPTLLALAKDGVRSVDVICPGFLADCLETVEEIAVECRDVFINAGGTQYRFIPCLNADEVWVDGLAELAKQHMLGWGNEPEDRGAQDCDRFVPGLENV